VLRNLSRGGKFCNGPPHIPVSERTIKKLPEMQSIAQATASTTLANSISVPSLKGLTIRQYLTLGGDAVISSLGKKTSLRHLLHHLYCLNRASGSLAEENGVMQKQGLLHCRVKYAHSSGLNRPRINVALWKRLVNAIRPHHHAR
jgi:hypothetical protein